MQKLLILLLSILFLNGCVERGYSLQPVKIKTNYTPTKSIHKQPKSMTKKRVSQKKKSIVNPSQPKQKPKAVTPKPVKNVVKQKRQQTQRAKETSQTKPLFTLSEETKNNISGFFIILIALMIFL